MQLIKIIISRNCIFVTPHKTPARRVTSPVVLYCVCSKVISRFCRPKSYVVIQCISNGDIATF